MAEREAKPRPFVDYDCEKMSLPDYVKKTLNNGRIMQIKNRVSSNTLASLQLAGNIPKETLI